MLSSGGKLDKDALSGPIARRPDCEGGGPHLSARRIKMTTSALSPNLWNSALQKQANCQLAGEHVVYFYQESDSLLEALCDFVGPALGAGNGAVVIATKIHREGLQRRLLARGLNTQGASKQGRYVALDGPEILSKIIVDGMPDRARFFEIVGGTIAGIRALLKGPSSRDRRIWRDGFVVVDGGQDRGRHSAGATLERTGEKTLFLSPLCLSSG